MGGSANLAPIPIPRGSAAIAPPPSNELLAPRSVSGASATGLHPGSIAAPARRRSVSRPRRSSHLPPASDSLGVTPPISPRLGYGESLGVSHRQHRKYSVSHKSPMVGSMPLSPRIPPQRRHPERRHPRSRTLTSSSRSARVLSAVSSSPEAHNGRLLRHQGAQEVGHDCQEPDHQRQGRAHDPHDAESVSVRGQALLHLPELRVLVPGDGVSPGGDCASLCKVLGGLSEEWARQYIAEVVIGLQHLHSKGVVHRDLKQTICSSTKRAISSSRTLVCPRSVCWDVRHAKLLQLLPLPLLLASSGTLPGPTRTADRSRARLPRSHPRHATRACRRPQAPPLATRPLLSLR